MQWRARRPCFVEIGFKLVGDVVTEMDLRFHSPVRIAYFTGGLLVLGGQTSNVNAR
jgi:hypothetical protein